MKKVYILTISLLLSGSNFIIAQTGTQDNPNNQSENKSQIDEGKNNQIANTGNTGNNTDNTINTSNTTYSEQNKAKYEEIPDKYDTLVNAAIDNGLEVKPMEKPTYLMNIVRQLGVIFFLNPYIFIVDNYRITKDFVIKYATITWEAVVGKKPEDETNGKIQE